MDGRAEVLDALYVYRGTPGAIHRRRDLGLIQQSVAQQPQPIADRAIAQDRTGLAVRLGVDYQSAGTVAHHLGDGHLTIHDLLVGYTD